MSDFHHNDIASHQTPGYNTSSGQPCCPLVIIPYRAPQHLHPCRSQTLGMGWKTLPERNPRNGEQFSNPDPLFRWHYAVGFASPVGIALALRGRMCPSRWHSVGIALALISEQLKELKSVWIRAIVGSTAFSPCRWGVPNPPRTPQTFFSVGIALALIDSILNELLSFMVNSKNK